MINIDDKKECCGCNACSQICPKQCIVMEKDLEGFLYPRANNALCVGCGLCERVCPVKNAENKDGDLLKGYAAYAKDDMLRNESSSGGIFSLLAKSVLNYEGIVFGAAFDDDYMVHHIGINSMDELYMLQGSKYLQSKIENTYIEAKRYLDNGKKVLFSGTACQVAGLKGYLRKEYSNLYTVDVLCHGVPSPDVWKRYLVEQKNNYGARPTKISFREKNNGWKKYSMSIEFEEAAVYRRSFAEDMFMKLFLGNICLRPSCHDCKFKSLNRKSDITIGDAWGIQNYMPEYDDDKGTSIILVHSKKGEQLLKMISQFVEMKEGDIEHLLPARADSRKSVKPHRNREKFFSQFREGMNCSELTVLLEESFFEKSKRHAKRAIHKVKESFNSF